MSAEMQNAVPLMRGRLRGERRGRRLYVAESQIAQLAQEQATEISRQSNP